MAKKKSTDDPKKKQKLRIQVKKAARRSGKLSKTEGKVDDAKSKKQLNISQKRAATIKKSRY
ncbi:MAG: hypothetical protein R3327_05175 [Nitrosopumilaceae archaeon]|nr:hypothetical protein [Nitrosopumilaceae archaeon]